MAEEAHYQNNPPGNYQMPSQVADDLREDSFQIVKVLTEHDGFLQIIRSEMRGEQYWEEDDGNRSWVQVDKPMFVKLDKNNEPLKVLNPKTKRKEYLCNDEAINEVISILKSCGLNPITPLTNISKEEIREDLLELECKIAMLLAVNRKKWGLNKAEYPMAVGKLKVMIKDARYRALDGTVLRALRTMTTRMEQSSEIKRDPKQGIGRGILN